ncbi:MAG: hypothetical protein IPH37_05875 [Burkholderiales bacterium]|nr:hypothetical protein [Burkholderiales bacterium]
MPTTHFHIATLHTQNDADAVLFELQDLPCIHVADVQLLAVGRPCEGGGLGGGWPPPGPGSCRGVLGWGGGGWWAMEARGTLPHYPCGDRARASAVTPLAPPPLVTHGDHPHVQRMLRFADGFVRLRQQNGQLWLTDLRMGQEGAYVFDFDLGPLAPQTQATRAVQHSQRAPIGKSLRWLWARMWGADLPALSAQDLRGGGD